MMNANEFSAWLVGIAGAAVAGGAGFITKMVLKHESQLNAIEERTTLIRASQVRMEDKQDAMYLYLISNNPRKDTEPPSATKL